MRREGRVHGVQLLAGTRVVGSGVRGKTNKPTNQSKSTAKNIAERKSFYTTSSTDPAVLRKPFGKEKLSYKEESFDITRNALVPDWKVYQQGDGEMSANCGCGKAFCDDLSCRACQASTEAENGYQEERWELNSPGAAMVVSIEDALHKKKGKKSKRTVWTEQNHRSSVVGGVDECAWESSVNLIDEAEEWWGIGYDEGEVVMDGWFLITEDAGFAAS